MHYDSECLGSVRFFFLYVKKLILLFGIKLIKSDRKNVLYIVTNISISISILFQIKDNNQKSFLSSKSVYYTDFWRSCDTEDWSNDAENTALISEINYIWTDIHIGNSCFKHITILL